MMMWNDPIVNEIHGIRAQLMKQAGGDLHQAIQLAHKARSPNRKIYRGQTNPSAQQPKISK
jgi:hypothetical protein